MKIIYRYIFLSLVFFLASCTDEALIENVASSAEDFNIEEFSDGFSLAFEVSLDNMDGGMSTRADYEAGIIEWENYLNPEEFRVLFFDKDDRYLFESKTRWLTPVPSHDGGNRWRVGVPVFQYVADEYDDTDPVNPGQPSEDGEYNWNRIVEIMKEQPFKVAILANRPSKVEVPELDDWKNDETFNKIAEMGSALNGPFWTPKNSIATENVNMDNVAKVFDLHHCQFDPLYYYKSENSKVTPSGDGWYDFIMEYGNYYDKKSKTTLTDVPFMGAAASWVSANRSRVVPDKYDNNKPRTIRYYRLPVDRKGDGHPNNGSLSYLGDGYDDEYQEINSDLLDENQYIPMYGIQQYDALTTWQKGKTYNLSEQTGSQTGNYNYRSIKLLRSVVKLELLIPMYDEAGNEVVIDNAWTQLWFSNYMSRCEPMDVSTSTRDIWNSKHEECEWKNIRDYDLLADNNKSGKNFKERLAWFYGSWKDLGWVFREGKNKEVGDDITIPDDTSNPPYPKIFNPLTQRLQGAFITDCYLPIEGQRENGKPIHPEEFFHRWVVYCGERNMNDQNNLGDATSDGTLLYFRIPVSRKNSSGQKVGNDCIYYLPITDYSAAGNPALDILKEDESKFQSKEVTIGDETITLKKDIKFMNGYGEHISPYIKVVMDATNRAHYPYPLLRNHLYKITISFNNSEKGIDVKVINGEQRNVGGIWFY